MTNKYKRTIFLPSLYGQYILWKNTFAKECNRADEVFQLGNFIGCNEYVQDKENTGPNFRMIKYLNLYKASQPNFTQLIGMNEIAALNSPEEWTNRYSRDILRGLWLSKNPVLKVATVSKNRLCTSSGMTYGEWKSIGSPETAQEAAGRLNEKYHNSLYQGECFRLTGVPSFSANPIWASPLKEVYPSWVTAKEECPFDQVHGTESVNNEIGHAMLNDKYSFLQYIEKVQYKNWGSRVKIKNAIFTAVDLGLNTDLLTKTPPPRTLYLEKTVK